MNYFEIKEALSAPNLAPGSIFPLLKGISKYVNDKDSIRYAQGRDLVIRTLAKREVCDDFESRILTSLVRSVGLYPYMTESLKHAEFDDRIAYELHRPDNMEEIFHSLQARIYYQLRSGSNVILSAPTSVGKSLIVDAIIALGKFKKIVIVVPTLALIDETRRRISRRFGSSCHVITHPSQTATTDRVNIYILTQERVLHRIDLTNVDFFVIDEFYKLDLRQDEEKDRAIALNVAFHKLAATGAQFYMIGPNIEAIRGLDRYEIHFIPADYATVAVDVVQFNLPKNGDERARKLVELSSKMRSPTLVYCSGPGSATRVAELLARQVMTGPNAATMPTAEWVSDNFHPQWATSQALAHGVGIHHGGIPRALQQHMVRLFNDGKLPFLVCTSTLIEGVNTAAENVIIYDRRRSRSNLNFFTYKNIQGRAGRMGRYFVGKVFVLEKAPADDDVVVEYPVDDQSETTPLSLIMQLDDDDLTEGSRQRIREVMDGSYLSLETVRQNSSIHPDLQNRVAAAILEQLKIDESIVTWRSLPGSAQLHFANGLIMRHISGPRMNEAGIGSAEQLSWYLRALASKDGIRGFLSQVADGTLPYQNVSDQIDKALKFMRNIAGFRFPQDLMAIHRIQLEVCEREEIRPGDYSYYAEQVENFFMSAPVAALEEYGLPLQLARKLSAYLEPAFDLDTVVDRLRNLVPEILTELTSFEQQFIRAVQEGL